MHRLRGGAALRPRQAEQTETRPGAALSRDAVTLLVYSHLGVYGYFLYGFGPSVPLLGHDLDVSRTLSGLHGTALALGAVATGLLGSRVVDRCGRGAILRAGLVGVVVGLLLFTLADTLALTLLGALVAGTSGSLVVNTHAPLLSDHHGPAGPAVISEANAVAAGGGMFAPLLVGLATSTGAGWRVGLLLTAALAAVVLAVGARIPVPPRVAPRAAAAPLPPVPRDRLPPRFWTAWAVIVLCVTIEFCLTFWSSELLRDRTGLAAGSAAQSVTALIAGMLIGRLVGAQLALRYSTDRLLLGALGLTVAGVAALWLSGNAALSITALFAVGAAIAPHFPLGLARALATSAGRPDLASARVSLGVGVAVGVGPFALGALADLVGTQRAFLALPLLAAVAGGFVLRAPVTTDTDQAAAPSADPLPAGSPATAAAEQARTASSAS